MAHSAGIATRTAQPTEHRAAPEAGGGEGRTPAIRLTRAVKSFGSIRAVDGVDFEVGHGVCVGLLGPNGAGKSTTMRLLTAQAIADAGEIEVLGHRIPRDSKRARAECGVVPQLDNLDPDLSARQNLAVFARLYRVPRAERSAAIDRALALAHLSHRGDARVDELSGGMRRRLLIARGLVHRPRLVLLDEPTVGLDPQVRHELWSLIDGLRARGVTVLMSTHYIEEAERLADTVAIMARGRIVAEGRPADLIAAHAGHQVLEVTGSAEHLAETERGLAAAGHRTLRTGPALAVLRAETLDGDVGGTRRVATLEDVFVALTGEPAE